MSKVYGNACYILAAPLDLSRMDSDADVQAQLKDTISDRSRTLYGPSGTIEGGKDSVAHPLHQVSAESSQLSIDGPIVLLEAFAPGAITERRRSFG